MEQITIKESSDELNPVVAVPESTVAPTRTPWKASDYLALSIATCGVGYLPLIPGTFGSMLGVGLFLLLTQIASGATQVALVAVSVVAIAVSGIWAASRTEELAGKKDPGKVVVDEVAGQMLALLPLTLMSLTRSTSAVIVSFTLFRFFDIVKPYPAGRLESLKGGFGIMCDDLVAGAYAAIIASVMIAIFGNSFF
jgi:phosphatidylglycerophosphatase A